MRSVSVAADVLFCTILEAENIEKWTEEALTDMGLTPAALLAP